MRSRLTTVFQIAAVYVGTIVGAGFATGKEIVAFFTQYGFYGFIGILIAGYLFIYIGTKMMLISIQIQANSYEEFNTLLFGKKFGIFINFLFLFMLIGVSGVMISGAAAIFEEQLNLSKQLGVWMTILLAMFVLMKGTKGLFAINSFIVPMMVSFSLLLCVLSVREGEFVTPLFTLPDGGLTIQILFSPFSYVAFNLALALAVLVPVATEVKHPASIKWGGILGGVLLTIILLSSHFALMNLPSVDQYEIPSAVIMKEVARNLYWLFILVIYGEIFTSVVGNIFGLERQIRQVLKIPSFAIFVLLFAIAYFISVIGYGRLLGFLYPIFGYISLLFIVLIWRQKLKN